MKVIKLFLILAILASVVLVAPSGSVQAALPGQCTGFQLQNTTGSTAQVNVSFYGVGTGVAQYSFPIPDIGPNASRSFYIPSYSGFSTLPPGSHSAVIGSTQNLNALVNQVTCAGQSPLVLASHSGMTLDNAGLVVYLPWVNARAYQQLWSSLIAVQNAGTGDTSVTLEFFKPGIAAAIKSFTQTVKQGETWQLDLSLPPYNVPELANFGGAVKITSSSQEVVAVANYAPNSGNKLLSYNGVTTGGQKLFAPQVNKNAFSGNYTSGLTLYNPNNTATPIRIDYIASGSTSATYSQVTEIPANNVFIQYLGALPNTSLPSNFNGTAVVTVTSGANKIFGVANLDSAIGQAAALNMIPVEEAQTSLYMPQIVRNNLSDPTKYQSGWQVVNTTGTNLNLTIEYWKDTDTSTPTFVDHKALPANSALTNYVGVMNQIPIPFNGGVIIKVDGGAGKIVGQGNFANNWVTNGDALSIYNAFPPSP